MHKVVHISITHGALSILAGPDVIFEADAIKVDAALLTTYPRLVENLHELQAMVISNAKGGSRAPVTILVDEDLRMVWRERPARCPQVYVLCN